MRDIPHHIALCKKINGVKKKAGKIGSALPGKYTCSGFFFKIFEILAGGHQIVQF